MPSMINRLCLTLVTWSSWMVDLLFTWLPIRSNNAAVSSSRGSAEPLLQSEKTLDLSVTWPNDLGFDTVREERAPIDLNVVGHIPKYAAGTIYRNGPGASEVRDNQGITVHRCSHWFDGFGQLHKFELIPGEKGIDRIRYSSRFSVDSLMQEISHSGRRSGYTFAQKRDPCMSTFRKAMCLFTPAPTATPNNCNIPVTVSASSIGFPSSALPQGHRPPEGLLVARTDESVMKALDLNTLEPIGIAYQSGLHPLLKGPMSGSHCKSDPETRDIFNYNLEFGPAAIYRVFKTSASTGETEILASITGPGIAPAYMHSFFLTENFVILAIWSAHLTAGGLSVLWHKNIMDAIAPFDRSRTAKWFVVDRRHGRGVVASFDSPACFCFHTVNAHEEASASEPGAVDVVCDLMQYDNLDILHKFYLENLRSSSPSAVQWTDQSHPGWNAHFARYRLEGVAAASGQAPLTRRQREMKSPLPRSRPAIKVKAIPSAVGAGDIPTINPRRITRPYRYIWNCTFDPEHSTFIDGLCKLDTLTGTGVRWENPKGHTPGEAIFVADPEGTDEDDGVLLSVVLDGFRGSSYLVCLDARTMKEVGRADCRGPLTFMFHGQHVARGEQPIDW